MTIESTEFTITIRSTSIAITPGGEAVDRLEKLLDLMTYEDEFAEETRCLGFLHDVESDTLFVHKGVDIGYLTKMLPNSTIKHDDYDEPKPMTFEYEEVIPPRNDEQVDVINFIAGLNHHSANLNDRQLFLIKQPGFG